MSRHAKNNTASSYFTYHERKKLDYGTKQQRLGKDSLQRFDCCCLTLQPAVFPVVTPEGYLFSKEAIYENLLEQKKEYSRTLKLWKEQQKRIALAEKEKEQEKVEKEVKKFESIENSILPVEHSKQKQLLDALEQVEGPSNLKARKLREDALQQAMKEEQTDLDQKLTEHAKILRAFWVPGVHGGEETEHIPKPSKKTLCPKSGKPLRAKQLVEVEFTPLKNVNEDDVDKVGKWMCPLCCTVLSNKTPLAVLKTSKKIMCKTCVTKFVLPEMKDPLNNLPVIPRDIIYLKSGGTGFAGKEGQESLVATKFDIAFAG